MTNLHLDNDDEPKRGASRANSVRFDESAIHYAHGSRSSDLLPMRTGSGMSSHPLTERSLSHRSDGRQSSSTRTNSLGLEGSRLLGSVINSPMISGIPPGLLILGPVPCIIRCWLSQNFSNDSLLYAAVCSGSYKSSVDSRLISHLQLDHLVQKDGEGNPRIKLPVYLPEATVSQASSRSSSPAPGLPALTINFIVRNFDCNEKAIQILLGSDVLRSHRADILFSQDRLSIFDDERNRLTIPFVRPEDDLAYKSLLTTSISPAVAVKTLVLNNSNVTEEGKNEELVSEPTPPGIIGRPARPPSLQTDLPASRTSTASVTSPPGLSDHIDHLDDTSSEHTHAKSSEPDHPLDNEGRPEPPARQDSGGIWGNWRRDSNAKTDSASQSSTASGYKSTRSSRSMKVLRPSKTPTSASSRSFSAAHPISGSDSTPLARRSSEIMGTNGQDMTQHTPAKVVSGSASKPTSANPVGGASAFGWLANAGQQKRATTTAE
jgi:hypothetical protein